MACNLDIRRLDEGLGGQKNKRNSQERAGDRDPETMDVDPLLYFSRRPSARQASRPSHLDNPEEPACFRGAHLRKRQGVRPQVEAAPPETRRRSGGRSLRRRSGGTRTRSGSRGMRGRRGSKRTLRGQPPSSRRSPTLRPRRRSPSRSRGSSSRPFPTSSARKKLLCLEAWPTGFTCYACTEP